ncbi:hypothetical protein R1flu_003882 [Riccia fluitans]|uniref:CCHC-type domain-containing protein n=1 Tax=Riccia fluitans TaxID=41844 RepID=A0ABD1YDB3_9MARC
MPQLVPAVPFCHFCKKSGHSFHEGCPEYVQKFASYRNQRGQGGQRAGRLAPGCKMLTPVMEGPVEGDQLSEIPGDDGKSVGDTPETIEEASKAFVGPTGTILQPEPVQDQASSTGQMKNLGKKEKLAAEVNRVHEKIFR